MFICFLLCELDVLFIDEKSVDLSLTFLVMAFQSCRQFSYSRAVHYFEIKNYEKKMLKYVFLSLQSTLGIRDLIHLYLINHLLKSDLEGGN